MDPLIDLIIYFIRQITKEKPPRITPAGFQEVERQKAVTEKRIREMQMTKAKQQARARPMGATRGPARRAIAAKAPAVARAVAPTPNVLARGALAINAAAGATGAPSPPALGGLRVSLILGEILGPPLALREPEL